MAIIFETDNFIVESSEKPHVTRTDGGHLRILAKKKFHDRTELLPRLAIEVMRLSMVVGEALPLAMKKRGIELIRVNYQEMGNWAYKLGIEPFFHWHIYGRAKNAKYQPYKEAVYLPDRSTGFYNKFEPLNEGDVKEIRKEILKVSKKKKYSDKEWSL
jgi:diadenosine tetraphosphate (Ap4A) HIT family hydrolase